MNFYNLKITHPENQLNPDTWPEIHEIHPFLGSRDQLPVPYR